MALAAQSYVSEHGAILQGSYPQALLHGQAPAARVLDILKRVARELVFLRPEVEALELEGYAALRGVLTSYACLLALPASQFARLLAGEGSQALFFARRLYHRLSARHLKAYRLAIATPDPRFACQQRAGVVLPGAAAARLRQRHDRYLCIGGVPAALGDLMPRGCLTGSIKCRKNVSKGVGRGLF